MRKTKFFIPVLAILSLISTSCANETASRNEFDKFTNSLFQEYVTSDSISYNYTLAHPENYGIPDMEPTLGNYTLEGVEQSVEESKKELAQLNKINYSHLTDDQKALYDILKYSYESDRGTEKFKLYYEVLDPSTGLQAQLPVLLAEFNILDQKNVEQYLGVLPCIYDAFSQIIEYEKKKSEAGLFMADFAVDEIVEQCQAFIDAGEENLLITFFNSRLEGFDFLTDEQRAQYREQNRDLVLNKVIPAYELLIKGLQDLKGTGKNEAGLSNFQYGKEFYQHLMRTSVGTDKTVEELLDMVNENISNCLMLMQRIISADPTILDRVESAEFSPEEPKEIVEHLKTEMLRVFPPLPQENVTYEIKEVDPSLQDYLSPAFYLTPQLDRWTENNIYLNKSDKFNNDTLFTTLAHEGYPGHLYQTVYFQQQEPDPLRAVLGFSGYTEGWGTYAELESYFMGGLDDAMAQLLRYNMELSLSLYSRADIGIHYEGWTREDTQKFVEDYFGITDQEVQDSFFNMVVENPANYPKYGIGFLEFKNLREKAQKTLGDQFDDIQFHTFLLETGPAPFPVVEKWMDAWMESLQKKAA